MKNVVLSLVVAGSSLVVVACGDDDATTTSIDTESTMETEAPMATDDAQSGDIVAVASEAGSFGTLVTALEAAGLVETLQGEGPFTVFAPTDEAFAALPAGLLDKLLLPENDDVLVKILKYHVISGEILAANVVAGEVRTVEGQNVTLSTVGGVRINGANVTSTDVMATNGVIHVIDAVLLPPDVDPASL